MAEQAQKEARRERKQAAVLNLFEAVDGGPFYVCKAHTLTSGTPCGRQLRVPSSGSSRVLTSHLQRYHPGEYGVLMMLLEQKLI